MTDLTHYVSGRLVLGTSSRFADVFNPATGAAEKRPRPRGCAAPASSTAPSSC